MANTEIFLRNIFGTTRPNIRPLVLALNITNDLLFEQHISMSDIKAISPCWNLFPIDTLTGACVPLNFLLYFSMQSALTNLSALLKL